MPSVFGAASIPFIGCVALLAAEVLTILAFASPYWAQEAADEATGPATDLGLWRRARCVPHSTGTQEQGRLGCYRTDMLWKGEDWQYATRGLESLAIIFFALPLIVLPVYIYVALGLYYRCLMGTCALSVLLGTLCNIAGVAVFGVKIGDTAAWSMGWCLIVCVIGGGLGLVAFIVLLIATINKPTFAPEKYFLSGFYVEQDRNRLYVVESDEPVKVIYPASDPALSPRPVSLTAVNPQLSTPPPTPAEQGVHNPALQP